MPLASTERINELILEGKTKQIFTEAVVGRLTSTSGSLTVEIIDPLGCRQRRFDLSSLTKVLSTATLLARFWKEKKVPLEVNCFHLIQHVARYAGWSGKMDEGWAQLNLKDVLSHRVKFPPRIELFERMSPTQVPPRKKVIAEYLKALVSQFQPENLRPDGGRHYSDVGFMLVGFYLEALTGLRLRDLFLKNIPTQLRGDLAFESDPNVTAPTEICAWRQRRLVAEVHEENTFLFGGDCGHAGLFGTIDGVGALFGAWASAVTKPNMFLTPELVKKFCAGRDGNYGWAWDSVSPQASGLGEGWSTETFGHWGFTGVGTWFDPSESDGLILLSNRVYYGREREAYASWRRHLFTKKPLIGSVSATST